MGTAHRLPSLSGAVFGFWVCSFFVPPPPSIAMADLAARDVEKGKFAFSIYDFEGNDTMDAFYIGDCLRALNLNPTNAAIEKLGGTKKKGEKKLKVEEFLPIYSEAKKSKDYGTIEDFLECMKLYDKSENGTMLAAELNHILLSLGERLEDKEVDAFFKDCVDAEDEEGNIPYQPFLEKMIAGPNQPPSE